MNFQFFFKYAPIYNEKHRGNQRVTSVERIEKKLPCFLTPAFMLDNPFDGNTGINAAFRHHYAFLPSRS